MHPIWHKCDMSEKLIVKNLMLIATTYAQAVDKSLTTVSKEFYGRGDFLVELENGKHTISIRRLDTLLADFREKWPKGAKWPQVSPVTMSRLPISD